MNLVGKTNLSIDGSYRGKSDNTVKDHTVGQHAAGAFITTTPVQLMANGHNAVIYGSGAQFIDTVVGHTHDTGTSTLSEQTPLILELVTKEIVMELDREDFKTPTIVNIEVIRILLDQLAVG
jgi:hypothetical protein